MKLTTKVILITIAIIACFITVVVRVRKRADSYHMLAVYHREASSKLLDDIRDLLPGEDADEGSTERMYNRMSPEEIRIYKASLYHSALWRKYSVAAKTPWFWVRIDPPKPPRSFPDIDMKDFSPEDDDYSFD